MTRKASRRIFVLRLDVLRNAFRQVKFKFLNLPSGWMTNVPRLTGQLRWETLESLATWQLREEIIAHGILPLTSIDKALLRSTRFKTVPRTYGCEGRKED